MDFKFYWRTNGAQRFLTRYGQNKSRTRQPINGYLMRFFGGGRRGTRRCAKLFPRSAEKDAARAEDFFLLFSFAPKQVLTRSQTKGKSPLVRALSFGGRNGTRRCAKLFPRSAEKDAARAEDFFLLFSFAPKQVLTRSQTKGKSPLVRALSFGGRNGTRTCDLSRVRRTL